MSKTRARSPEKKEKQFRKIIQEGRKLFLEFGSDGLSMRVLAKKLGMQQGNLYNYVQSKRELWFAVITEDFQLFTSKMQKIITQHQNTKMDLLEKVGSFYIDFALEDLERYRMLFLTTAPPSTSIGPIESNYQPLSFDFMLQIVQEAIEKGELSGVEPSKFTIFIWGIIHGNISLLQPESLFPKQYAQKLDYQNKYGDFLKQQIKRILASYSK